MPSSASPISINWNKEFARVISCKHCTSSTDRALLRDEAENVPQPGYVGKDYFKSRVILIGQNPGTPKTLGLKDQPYTAALRALRDLPNATNYRTLSKVLEDFIPQWPVQARHFPLHECGLTLNDIAYFNLVRCRTIEDRAPSKKLSDACVSQHFDRWVQVMQPRVVIFIGKWASDRAATRLEEVGVPSAYVNRLRNLTLTERAMNRKAVVDLVRAHIPVRLP